MRYIVGFVLFLATAPTWAQPGFVGGFGSLAEILGETLTPEEIKPEDGAAQLPDHAAYHQLSYRGQQVLIDTFLADLEFVKFSLNNASTPQRRLYFINTKKHRAHMMFARVAGLPARGGDIMKGVLVYRPRLKSPSGQPGLYTFEFEPFDSYSFQMVKTCLDELTAKMPVLKGNIGYYPRGQRAQARYRQEKELYAQANLKVYGEEELNNTDVGYLPLNPGATFGRLRLMELDQTPSPRDVVICKTLPNEMPRVAGIITAVRQTPLSHVNLRAVQDRIPNAFIDQAAENKKLQSLLGKYVSYQVTADGYQIREAKTEEVAAHFAKRRPPQPQTPPRDLSQKTIRPLKEIGFKDSAGVGVKAANTAVLGTFGFPEGTVPDGFAIPFYFYDEFMKHNGFYDYAEELMKHPQFQSSLDVQRAQLKKFRKLIEKGKMPLWMLDALDEVHKTFPAGQSVRCRSSTNNEDLPGFSGAGLYDSYTHKPDEGHFSKSIKQVYASLWSYRAFEERAFYRVDHLTAAMGVLVHPNFKGELANGVAVTDDILYQTEGTYYLNTQQGEDLVTNPEAASVPEEGVLDWWKSDDYQIMRTSNRSPDKSLLAPQHLEQLRKHLGTIHAKFARLYGKSLDEEQFAMEIEFKITKDNRLVIKQARPWVYAQPVSANQEPQP